MQPVEYRPVSHSKVAANGARMEAVRRDSGSLQPSRQLAGPENICRLRLAVDAQRGIAAFILEIIEIEPTHAVTVGSDTDDAGRGAAPQERQEQPGEKEVGQVVHGKGGLESVHRRRAGGDEGRRIVHQDIDATGDCRDLVRQSAYRRQ